MLADIYLVLPLTSVESGHLLWEFSIATVDEISKWERWNIFLFDFTTKFPKCHHSTLKTIKLYYCFTVSWYLFNLFHYLKCSFYDGDILLQSWLLLNRNLTLVHPTFDQCGFIAIVNISLLKVESNFRRKLQCRKLKDEGFGSHGLSSVWETESSGEFSLILIWLLVFGSIVPFLQEPHYETPITSP